MAYKGIATYQYDSNGSLLSETTTQLDYATGQILTTDPATGLPIQPQVKSYSYNAFNQNISVTNADGSYQQNIYDALGLRISTIENGSRSDYIFDRGNIIAEFDGSGTLTSRNIRGYGLIAQKDEKSRLSYYLHNAHGDVTSMIDASGKVLNIYQYDAFGNTMSYAETVANRFRYAGEQFDTITGQYYLRARYYDPTVGRFTQEDAYRGDGLNLYAYVGNNPVNFIDPSGHCKDEIKIAVNDHLLNNPNIPENIKDVLTTIIEWPGKTLEDLYKLDTKKMEHQPIQISIEENTIKIQIFVAFTGDASKIFPDLGGLTYGEVAVQGIASRWDSDLSGQEFEINGVKAKVDLQIYSNSYNPNKVLQPVLCSNKQEFLKIGIQDKAGRAYVEYSNLPLGIDFWSDWSITNPGEQHLYTKEANSDARPLEEFKNTVAHEFAHNLGIGDAYGEKGYRDAAPSWAAPENDIMRDSRNGVVSSQDIAMILKAWTTNKPQDFPQK